VSHLHFPDGLLPLWLLAAGFVITGFILAVCLRKLQRDEDFVRKVSLLAVLAALMLVAMSIPLGFIHYHVNLTILVSLLLGPWLAFIGVFVVNFFLGFLGHGGLTVVGLNTLVLGSEVFLAYYIFFGLRRLFKTVPSVLGTTVITLLLSSLLMVSIVAAAGLSPAWLEDDHHHDHEHHDHEHARHDHGSHDHDPGHAGGFWGYLEAYAKFILPLLLLGALIEAAVTGGIVAYLHKVKPGLVEPLYAEGKPAAREG
jgi:cobalt/nickel transport system permease protein